MPALRTPRPFTHNRPTHLKAIYQSIQKTTDSKAKKKDGDKIHKIHCTIKLTKKTSAPREADEKYIFIKTSMIYTSVQTAAVQAVACVALFASVVVIFGPQPPLLQRKLIPVVTGSAFSRAAPKQYVLLPPTFP